MKLNDAVLGACFIVFGGTLYYLSKDFPILPGQAYGADLFPRTIAVLMALGGALLIPRGLQARRRGEPWATRFDWLAVPRASASFVLVVAILVFYMLASDALGFLITGFASLLVLLVWLRGASTFPSSSLIALATVLVIQVIFGQLLRVPLPWGVLQSYAW